MYVEKRLRTWEALLSPAYEWQVGLNNRKRGRLKGDRESDQLIVLRERESRLHGKGAGGSTQSAKETSAGLSGRITDANLTAGNSKEGGVILSCPFGKRAWIIRRGEVKSAIRFD